MSVNKTLRRQRIYLLRHAQVSYFDDAGRPLQPQEVRLTAEGRCQAQASGQMLADIPFDLAVVSGLPRTVETAQLVLGKHDQRLYEEPRLREIRAGRLREVPKDRLESILAYAYDHADKADAGFIGGERWHDFAERVLAAWNELVLQRFEHLLVVAHDAVNRVILSDACNAGLGALKHFEQDPACVNIIDLDIQNGQVKRALIRAIGITPYNLTKTGIQLTVMEAIHRGYKGD
jgi:broad specificity phosphatase PhoE